ncbi:MAG TPA: 2-amino-4-hydroxy-6-hydroxymethyldihydropteridine diphosphokinase [Candidatus Micrarchaeaceae archaeon]|nr:2-amino-4-hydroxy-6-hydroxymethyldihydropteridine diphosphokinase [Candidatus Micrarchaeaceae archaeon]
MRGRLTIAYLGLGTNLGSRRRNLSAARRRLRQKGVRILRQSRVIETEPWGDPDQPRFLNQVLEVEWADTPRRLLAAAKAVELEGGRKPTRRWGPRVIDVDILLFGVERVSDRDLEIPHPGVKDREFVQQSLRELGVAPTYPGRAFVKR